MQNGYYSTTGAMVTQFNRLDVISNNLANVNTTAFKRDDVVVGDFKRIFQEAKDEMPLKSYRMMHGNARLSADEKKELLDFFNTINPH